MRFAFSAPTGTESERDALFRSYRAAGYDGLQLKKAQFIEYIDRPRQFIDEWEAQEGIASGLIVGGDLDDTGLAALQRHLSFASAVGAERVIFCHSRARDSVSTDDIQQFARVLAEVGKTALDQGTRLSLHHHFNQPVMYREDFDVFFETVPDTPVRLTVDTAHLVKSGIDDIASVVRDFGGYIDNFHLKDFSDGEFRVLGHGDIDFDPVFTAIRSINFDGWLCADEESGGDIRDTLSWCYEFMVSKANAAAPADEVKRA